MSRDEFTCQSCADGTKTLNVHHKFYKKGAKPWEYDASALVTLCEDCHEWVTKERAALQASLAAFPERLLPLLRGFIDAIASIEDEGGRFTPDLTESNHIMGAALAMYYPPSDLWDAIDSSPLPFDLKAFWIARNQRG